MGKHPDTVYIEQLLSGPNPPQRKAIKMRPGGVATPPHPITDVGEPPEGHRWETDTEFAGRVRRGL